VDFFFTAIVLMAAGILRCSAMDWCLLVLAIGIVLTAELFNSAIETLFRELDDATRDRAWPCLDIAAAAVLLASIVAAVIGFLVFGQRLLHLYLQDV
jgi:diacylglycerol kinase